jgi:hypothetical protein
LGHPVQGQEAVHVVGGFTDRLADELTGGIVVVFQDFHQFAVFCGQRFLAAAS